MTWHGPWLGSDGHFIWLFGFDEWWHTRSMAEQMIYIWGKP